MSNLFGIGLSGLGAAQAGLRTTSNNIANVNTPGYTRRSALLGQAPVSQGQGTGVLVSGIQRQYQRFLSEQLNNAESRASALDAHLSQMSRINNLLGDSDAGLAPLMQEFFASIQTVAGSPADPAARQSLLGDAQNMASQFRTFSAYLAAMHGSVEMQLQGAVEQINNYGQQVAHLNEQISLTRARTGQPPNKLLDQRNQLVSELGKLVDVTVTIQDGEQYMLMVAGRSLVDATGAHSFEMTVSSRDPGRQVIAYRTPTGGARELDPESFTGGTVGGLIEFRNESLQPAQLRVNQLAHALATAVNAQHQEGYDLNGIAGEEFFSVDSSPVIYANKENSAGATLTVKFKSNPSDPTDFSELSKVAASNYRIEYTSSGYQVTRLSDGTTWPAAASPFSKDGLKFTFSGAAPGDSFLVKPLANSAASLEVAIDDPAKIAAAGDDGNDASNGVGDNGNALALAGLQSSNLIGGTASFNDAYAQLVSDVGNTTRSLQVNSAAQTSLTTELQKAEQSVSGVNLAEERVNLLYYSKLYQANAKIIQTATNLFDTILRIA